MKEWLQKMAKELGLPADTADDVVLAKLSEKILGGDARLSSVTAQLAAHGLKLDGDKVVKLEANRNPDDVKRIAEQDLELAKAKLASGKELVDRLMATGKVPPALKASLERVMSTSGKLETLQLSKNGDSEVVIKGTIDILSDLKALFDSIPGLTGGKLSTVLPGQPATPPDPNAPKPGDLGRSIAARLKPKQKKEPAAK